jgi:ubiquinone/menaquinone biosynthesis C-methylase UbiE
MAVGGQARGLIYPTTMPGKEHKSVVQESFTRQAEAYAAAPVITDPERLRRLVEAIAPARGAHALDVATGPGLLALALAERCREVVGVDLTEAPLAIAERNRRERGATNVRFQKGDADRLPFADGEFDIVICRFALHHFEHPTRVLMEMARVSREKVAVEDLEASESPAQAQYHNKFERLRDPSHTRALAASELIAMFAACGLKIERQYSDHLEQNLERWLATTQTPVGRAAEVRAMIERDAREDLSGTRPFLRDGQWFFRQQTLALVGRKI